MDPRWFDNRAWLLLLPALAVLAVVGGLPLLAVINYALHDIFTLTEIHWVGLQWFQDILGGAQFWASLGRSLLFAGLALAVQVPLGIAVAKLLLTYGRKAVWGLVLCALPLVVPWNMIAPADRFALNCAGTSLNQIGPAAETASPFSRRTTQGPVGHLQKPVQSEGIDDSLSRYRRGGG